MLTFAEIAERFLRQQGYKAHPCETEEEARERVEELIAGGRWPCYFFASDTTGEKPYEEFIASGERADLGRFEGLGVITETPVTDAEAVGVFTERLKELRHGWIPTKVEIVGLMESLLPEFAHAETGKHLDDRM